MRPPRNFELDDSLAFAALSGDANPLHVDPLAARRTAFGRPVIHGVHLLLAALDTACMQTAARCLTHLRAVFRAPVLIQQIPSFKTSASGAGCTVRVEVEDSPVADFSWKWEIGKECSEAESARFRQEVELGKAIELDFMQASDANGTIMPRYDRVELRKLFPNAATCLPVDQLCALTGVSKLVGMECPGLYSLLSQIDLTFSRSSRTATSITYNVEQADERFQRLVIALNGCGCRGRAIAFLRPKPRTQLSSTDAVKWVSANEFQGRTALVIGGSRGLGEVCAKLLAAGGAEVWLAYASGLEDANRVAAEIQAVSGMAHCVHLDLRRPAESPLWELLPDTDELDLFCFATPAITAGQMDVFSPEKFREFCDFYVVGVAEMLRHICRLGRRTSHMLCPSSVFVGEPPQQMGEYIAAKAASEALCQYLSKHWDGLTAQAPRWPRLATDQTLSMIPEDFPDAAAVVVESIRRLYSDD